MGAFAIRGPISRSDLPGLCDRLGEVLSTSATGDDLLCDVSHVDPDAVAVDALARLQLAACRHHSRIRLRSASAELLELVAFMGLGDVLTS
jgi:ABC-type transporter Mla MlaB component